MNIRMQIRYFSLRIIGIKYLLLIQLSYFFTDFNRHSYISLFSSLSIVKLSEDIFISSYLILYWSSLF